MNTLYIYAAVYDFALFPSSYTKRLYLCYLCISIYLPFPLILISVYVYFDCFYVVPFQMILFVEQYGVILYCGLIPVPST